MEIHLINLLKVAGKVTKEDVEDNIVATVMVATAVYIAATGLHHSTFGMGRI